MLQASFKTTGFCHSMDRFTSPLLADGDRRLVLTSVTIAHVRH